MSLQQGPLDLAEMAGTVAVITGCANRGIGWGLCKQCAEMGMSVSWAAAQCPDVLLRLLLPARPACCAL